MTNELKLLYAFVAGVILDRLVIPVLVVLIELFSNFGTKVSSDWQNQMDHAEIDKQEKIEKIKISLGKEGDKDGKSLAKFGFHMNPPTEAIGIEEDDDEMDDCDE